MDKMKKYLLMLAVLAVGVVVSFTMTACSSSDDVLEEPEEEQLTLGDAIKAQFTISIPTAAGGTTRQASAIVNSSGSISDFGGIYFIKLYPSASLPNVFDGGENATIIGKNIALTHLVIPTTATVDNYIPSQQLLGTNNSVLYGDVQLQLGTRTFLFYGMAIGNKAVYDENTHKLIIDRTTDNSTSKGWNSTLDSYTWQEKFVNGFLNQSGLVDQPGNVTNVKFTPEPITTATKSNTKRTAIITYLNSIADANGWSASTNAGFQALYTAFTSMQAGSSANLQVAIKDLYFALKDNTDPVAVAICGKIKNDTYVTIDDNAGTLVFKSNIAGYPSGDVTKATDDSDHLPDGAAVLSWNSTSKFSYTTAKLSTSAMTVTDLTSYVYPACLYYWGKSGILTSEVSKKDLYVNTKSWDEIANATNFTNGNAITSKTQSVVLTDPVQYAVGRLDISVVPALSSTSSTLMELTDNGQGVNANTVDVSKLKLTGVLIGGQKPVDWKFEPLTGPTVSEYTIYDNIEVSNTQGGLALQTSHDNVLNHTLVLESTGKVGDVEDEVKVALEFINNDKDFIGKDGIVPVGTKFYLVGSLKAGDYKTNEGYTATGGKVFKQDFVTRAKFSIANLTKAINTIPDLRNPKVELGLSVDLSWKTGIPFDIVIN